MFWRIFAVAVACSSAAAAEQGWTEAASAHFEVYAQAGPQVARSTLQGFEQLRAFFATQMNLQPGARPPVRVIVFRSLQEYNAYRPRPTADAFYVGTESRDTIVMGGPVWIGVAAHEYAHVLLHAHGPGIPSWLNEGIAELFSSVRMSPLGSAIGGDLPARSQALKRDWMPFSELLAVTPDSPLRNDRRRDSLFYAESWALAHMLMLSPQYRSAFTACLTALENGESAAVAFERAYGKSVAAVEHDARDWAQGRRFTPVAMEGVGPQKVAVTTKELAPVSSRLVLARVLFDAGDLNHAEAAYRELEREAPSQPEIPAALGAIALRRGDREAAKAEWARAIQQGVADAPLCYRYAVIAQDAGLTADEIRPALERAVMLEPRFDDARYMLALVEMNSGRYEAAVTHFRAMDTIAPPRRFGYWSGLAYSLNESGKREEAKAAAREAERYASNPQEHAHASQIGYMADTDLAVRFTRDSEGRAQIVTTRAPHGDPNWNPFVEPGDRMHHVDGVLREIRCGAGFTRFIVAEDAKTLVLTIADPTRVQMRNAPADFTCAAQQPSVRVKVDYAATDGAESDGLVRGVEFLPNVPHSGESPTPDRSKDPR